MKLCYAIWRKVSSPIKRQRHRCANSATRMTRLALTARFGLIWPKWALRALSSTKIMVVWIWASWRRVLSPSKWAVISRRLHFCPRPYSRQQLFAKAAQWSRNLNGSRKSRAARRLSRSPSMRGQSIIRAAHHGR